MGDECRAGGVELALQLGQTDSQLLRIEVDPSAQQLAEILLHVGNPLLAYLAIGHHFVQLEPVAIGDIAPQPHADDLLKALGLQLP